MSVWSFVFGLAIGSFLNVLACRYDPEKFLLNKESLGGRSACPKCGNKLKWFELIPLLSFIILRARCRNCQSRISFEYPLVEISSALIFTLVPWGLSRLPFFNFFGLSTSYWLLTASYILVLETLLLITLIDVRLKLIPDELNIFLVCLGFIIGFFSRIHFDYVNGSFVGSYAAIFGLRGNVWINHIVASIVAAVFFGFIIFITRGKGMGMGDLKLIAALGLVFGWPDIIMIAALSFIVGSIFSLPALVFRKKHLKSFIPFGPFIATAAAIVFFFGEDLMHLYFSLFRG